MTQRVVIVGAGISGLAAAFRIRQRLPTADIIVLELRSTPGGNVGTLARDGFRIELGPNGLFDAKPHALDLCRDLGLGERLVPGSEAARKNRYVFLRDRLRALPNSVWSFVTSGVLSPRAKLNLLLERYRRPTIAAGDESIAAFARRRGGREIAETLVDAFVTGTHAGDAELLSVRAAFPRLVEFERAHGSVTRGFAAARKERRRAALARGEQPQPPRMWSFREGLQVWIDALRDRLGSSLLTGVAVRRVERTSAGWLVRGDGQDAWPADDVVLTAHAPEQAAMLADLDPALAKEVGEIAYNRVAVVAVGYRASDVPKGLNGFGYLSPQHDRRDVLGVQWCSMVFPDRAPPGMVLWRALCGGWHRGEMVDWPDDQLVAAVREELRKTTGVTAAPIIDHVVRWPRAIPQYLVGHPARVERIEALAARHPGLHLGGNAYRGVALNDCCEQALAIAERIAKPQTA
jgi:protoporphyrinogen/coproporphyrinogen III oxidase